MQLLIYAAIRCRWQQLFLNLVEVVEATLQEVEEVGGRLIESVGSLKGMTLRIEYHIIRLSVGTEFCALQVTPFVAYGAEGAFLTI